MSAFIRTVGEFEQEREEYCDRLEYYFQANGITDESKKKSIFLVIIGLSSLKLLRNLVALTKPHDKTLQELITVFKQHYNPTPSVIVQRFKFHTRSRKPSESIATLIKGYS